MSKKLIIEVSQSRMNNLYDELKYAVNKTSREELKGWAKDSGYLFGQLIVRRGKGLLQAVGRGAKFLGKEMLSFGESIKDGRLVEHSKNRGATLINTVVKFSKKTLEVVVMIATKLKTNPKEFAPKLFIIFAGFLLGSGGFDGDGGIPDADLKMGIGHHRSILTHSILPALVIETVAFSLVGLVAVVYKNLPNNHDRFWDKLKSKNEELTTAFVQGTCAGIAYHLLVDMNPTADTIKPYADLPFSTTMEGHQSIFGANAFVEIVDLDKKGSVK